MRGYLPQLLWACILPLEDRASLSLSELQCQQQRKNNSSTTTASVQGMQLRVQLSSWCLCYVPPWDQLTKLEILLLFLSVNLSCLECVPSAPVCSYGLDLFLLSIDEGISGYRDDSLDTVGGVLWC